MEEVTAGATDMDVIATELVVADVLVVETAGIVVAGRAGSIRRSETDARGLAISGTELDIWVDGGGGGGGGGGGAAY